MAKWKILTQMQKSNKHGDYPTKVLKVYRPIPTGELDENGEEQVRFGKPIHKMLLSDGQAIHTITYTESSRKVKNYFDGRVRVVDQSGFTYQYPDKVTYNDRPTTVNGIYYAKGKRELSRTKMSEAKMKAEDFSNFLENKVGYDLANEIMGEFGFVLERV